jgi:YVTN family beta-propeller protein
MDTCTRLLEGAQTAMRPGLLFRRDFLALASMAGVSVVFAPVRRAAAGPPSPNPYAATRPGQFSPAVAGIPERVYVPNTKSNTVDVIDPATFTRVGHFPVGATPHHITPSWDLRRLYVTNTWGNSLTVIDPRTATPTETIAVANPYNLYFTLDGTRALVVAEREWRLDVRDPHTWALLAEIPVPWAGVDHLDFSADGRFLLASCEYSGVVVKVDTRALRLVGSLRVGGLPVDVRLSPDGELFYVANQGRHGVSVIDPVALREVAFLPTGKGAHGLQVSRDARLLYVSNRLAGSISVIECAARRVADTWHVGGSPDMLQLSPDGRYLWTSNRFGDTVSVVDTRAGTLHRTIHVGAGPHGLAYFPQPGRLCLGHNGVYR